MVVGGSSPLLQCPPRNASERGAPGALPRGRPRTTPWEGALAPAPARYQWPPLVVSLVATPSMQTCQDPVKCALLRE
ncbi:hypothetical protein P7K49_036495 [Saguinus oedipus]|uniref:Uncharacterized protein n=1 Tax=Saguinus oedipus TaxID=9490 RepID=A0ABQ9TL03_SAGOE|nr:hypothetical protein P7K49_036495 [Saguinus oedipus]